MPHKLMHTLSIQTVSKRFRIKCVYGSATSDVNVEYVFYFLHYFLRSRHIQVKFKIDHAMQNTYIVRFLI